MNFSNFSRKAAGGLIAAAALAIAVPAGVSAKDYVLTAGQWGKKQSRAVEAAGGTIVWSHRRTGIGVVSARGGDFLDRIAASKAFQTASPDMIVQWQPNTPSEQAITPGDEGFFPLQWHLPAIGAPDAWDAGCTGDGARVAVIDGGIYDIHPDLEPNLNKACSVSFVPGQPYNTDTGTFWHGTHVAGIVAAADNGFGVLGVAPEAELMHIKALHDGSGSFGAVIGGILYASDPSAFGLGGCDRADIINMSLGAIFPKSAEGGGQLVGAMNRAVNFAKSQGVLVVSSAGNNGIDMRDFPSFTHVPSDSGSGLSISATGPLGWALGATNFDRPASYSNFGNGTVWVSATGGDFVLPGEDPCTVGGLTRPCWVFDLVFSTCRGPDPAPDFFFCWAAGTSMAAPTASGVAALIKGANPGFSAGDLKEALADTAHDSGPTGHDAFHGHGWVNAANACID